MTPSQWASAAGKLARANPQLTRAQIITKMNLDGMPRPTGVENKGTDRKGNLKFGTKTRSPGQKSRRINHEKTSTPQSTDNLKQLEQDRNEINNVAAYAGLDPAHPEHTAPSDMTDMLPDEGAPGDFVNNRPKSYSDWKTATEQYIRTKHPDYRLVETPEGPRIVDRRYADNRVDPYELPGMNVDESMDIEQIFNVLPFMISQDLALKKTQFPGAEQQSPIKTTGGRVVYRPPSLPGFMEQERTPQVTPPQSKYVPPVVMQYSHETYTNGENGTNGDNGHSHSNGSPPKNGGNGGNGNGGLVNGLIDMTRDYEPEHKDINDLAPLFIGGRVVLQTVGGLVTASP